MERTINKKPFYPLRIAVSTIQLFIGRFIAFFSILLITMIRPILGPASCKFQETCTPYALRHLKEKNIVIALYAITKRLIACSPFYKLLQ